MPDNKLENKIREHVGEIFGRSKEPPAGHRGRFEQRLKELRVDSETVSRKGAGCPVRVEEDGYTGNTASVEPSEQSGIVQKTGKVISLKKWLVASVAVAAVVSVFLFLSDLSYGSQPSPELADVRNYYNMQLEEQVDVTRQLVQHVDKAHREALLANIEQIENEPVPVVQIPDDEYIVLIADVYTNKIETLQNLQNIIRENI
jgi:hypothetical protein